MSFVLRMVLLVSALLVAVWILRKLYKSKVKLGDAIFWVCLSVMLAVLGIVPEIAYVCADLIGIQAPSNFIFLAVLGLLLYKLFTLSIKVSYLEDKITVLSAEVALRSHNLEKRTEELEEEK